MGRGKIWVENFRVKKFEKYKPVHIVDLGHVLGQHIETLLDIFWIGLIDAPDAPTENQIRLTFFILKIKIIHTDKICVPCPSPEFPDFYHRYHRVIRAGMRWLNKLFILDNLIII